jgi:regulator of protease activity HflC (stomatin/prohibitin superfamily)
MTLVEILSNNILALLPVKVIQSYERGVKFHLGRDVALLEPGLYFFIPFVQSIEVVHVVPEVINLATQTVLTADGHPVTFSANIEFEIEDARAMFCKVQDFQNSLANLAMNHLAQKIRAWTLSELNAGQKDLEKSLKDTMTTRVKKWGVVVLSVGITDLVTTKAYRLYGGNENGLG